MAVVSPCCETSGSLHQTGETLICYIYYRTFCNFYNLDCQLKHGRKVRIKSSPYDPYKLGYTCATMVITIRCEKVILSNSFKGYLSSDCRLQIDYMKAESLVIVNKNVTVNLCLSSIHTARHTPGVTSFEAY